MLKKGSGANIRKCLFDIIENVFELYIGMNLTPNRRLVKHLFGVITMLEHEWVWESETESAEEIMKRPG